jgi:pilus assembly protein Flp/PilA
MLLKHCATWLWCALVLKGQHAAAEKGQGLMEYALILVLVALIVIIILAVVGVAVRDGLYENIIENI